MNNIIRFFAILLLAFSTPAFAQTVTPVQHDAVDPDNPEVQRIADASAATNLYIKEVFDFNLSTGIDINAVQSASAIAVNTAHADGLYRFGGSSEGGAVARCDTKRNPPEDWAAVVPTEVDNGCAGG